MHSDLINKIEKARHYAEEPERIQIQQMKALFQGSNSEHVVTYQDGTWHCDSPSFQRFGTSPHIMAMQRVLASMLPDHARHGGDIVGTHMHSDMISKIEKARRYAEEPERIQIIELQATFRGSNSNHVITLQDGQWASDDEFFRNWGTSAHIMAMQRVLEPMLPTEAREPMMSVGSVAATEAL
jgi:hypothetical protein